MKKWFLVLIFWLALGGHWKVEADVDYRILSYTGDLVIQSDNTADFTQTLVFDYQSDYRGQYITLGTAGQVPEGFAIVGQPAVQAKKNQTPVDIQVQEEAWHDGRQLKIYNGGQAGDQVTLIVQWQLTNVLHHYQDIAELNWLPISDWEVPLEAVHFTVRTDRASPDSQLFVHQGHFKPKVTVQSQEGYHRFSASQVSRLDIHAYWDKAVLEGPALLTRNGLPDFLATEAAIVQAEKDLQARLYVWLPVAGGGVLLLSGLAYLAFRRPLGLSSKLPKRVYQIPEDLSPLEVAYFVYNERLEDSISQTDGDLPLEQVIQATLLDLIDRKHLTLEANGNSPKLIRQEQPGLADYETKFLSMALADQDQIALDQLFEDYIYNKGVEAHLKKRLRGAQLEREVRQYGKTYLNRFRTDLGQISQRLAASRPDWVSYYRPLATKEWALSMLGWGLLIGLGGLSVYGFFTSLDYGQASALIYLTLAGLGLILALLLAKTYAKVAKRGVPTPRGQLALEPWEGFRQMLRDIKTFNRVDLDGLVVWNRVLVYATLFGQAKQVEDYIRLNRIDLSDQSGIDLSHRNYFLVQNAIRQNLVNSSQAASQASHFSVENRSSSGISGGFSGGGGGGGGGSF